LYRKTVCLAVAEIEKDRVATVFLVGLETAETKGFLGFGDDRAVMRVLAYLDELRAVHGDVVSPELALKLDFVFMCHGV
jgi:hypothetical protein